MNLSSGACAPVSATILQTLRDGTRSEHHQIERVVRLQDPDLKHDEYIRHLDRLLPFLQAAEYSLRGWAADWPPSLTIQRRFKTRLIEADLLQLGIAPRAPGEPVPFQLATLSHAWGCLYVLEGSTLGGQVLSRHIYKTLGIHRLTGGSYFCGYGLETGPMWQAFRSSLVTFVELGGDSQSIVSGAKHTFTALTEWLGASFGQRH